MAKHPMTPADLYRFRWPQDPHCSPDGAMVAWTEVGLDREGDQPVSAVMVAAADGSGEPRRFAGGPHDFNARWSPDGRFLAYLGATDGPPALHLAPLGGGAPRRVETPGPVKELAWSPAGDRLVLVVTTGTRPEQDEKGRPNQAPRVLRGLRSRLDGAGWLDGRDHLFVHDVGSGRTTELSGGDYDHASPAWSPDGTSIAFLSDRSRRRDGALGRADLWVLASAGRRAPTRVTGDIGTPSFLSWSPDGRHLAVVGVVGTERSAGRNLHLLVLPADGSGPPQEVPEELDRPAGISFGPPPYAWLGPDELAVTVADRGAVHLRSARVGERSSRQLLGGDRIVAGVSVSSPARPGAPLRCAVTSAWIDALPEVLTIQVGRRAGQPVQVSRAGDEMRKAVQLLPAQRHTVEAPDGVEVEYFAVRPPARARRAGGPKPPLFVEIHGGPTLHHPFAETIVNYQILAGAGYTLVLPNPRGSTSYGEKFLAMVIGSWGDGPLGDVLACCDDAIARGLADGDRQFVGGYSYGGYLSSFAVGHTNRFRAATIGAPVVDLVSMFGTSDANVYFADTFDGDPWGEPERYREQSPVTYLPKVSTPVFLYVNDGDLRCPPGQADELYTGLAYRNVEVEYARYPGGAHLSNFPMLGTPSQNEDRMRRILAWCAKHGGAPEAGAG